MEAEVHFGIVLGPKKNNMNLDFEPTILGITVLVISISQINEGLQSLLLLATIVYTIIKIYQLIKKK
jgi:hypothetical protein